MCRLEGPRQHHIKACCAAASERHLELVNVRRGLGGGSPPSLTLPVTWLIKRDSLEVLFFAKEGLADMQEVKPHSSAWLRRYLNSDYR